MHVGYVVWPPTVIKDPNTQELSGHFIETIKYIADEIGVDVEYTEVTWNTFIAGLQARQYDIAIAGTYVTIPRARSVSYSRPLFYLGNAAVVRKGSESVSDPKDFDQEGLILAVTQGTGEHDYAQRYFSKVHIRAFESPDLTLPLMEVLNGRADVAFTDTYTAREFSERHNNLQALFIDNPFNLTAVAWTVRRGDQDLLQFLNSSILYLEISGRLAEFERQFNANWLHEKHNWE